MSLVRYKKANDLWNINDTFKSIFDHPFFSMKDDAMNVSNFTPRTRITEDRDNFYINMEMPGISKDDLKISLENNVLSISGEKKQTQKTEETNLIMNEIYYGEFCRSFNVTNEIKADGIEADFKDGILTVTLPKVEDAKPVVKEIKVK